MIKFIAQPDSLLVYAKGLSVGNFFLGPALEIRSSLLSSIFVAGFSRTQLVLCTTHR